MFVSLAASSDTTFVGLTLSAAVDGDIDIDGDGFDDVLLGTGSSAGEAYVFLGPVPSGAVNVADAQATITGVAPMDNLGSAVIGLQDYNGDGLADFAAAADEVATAYVFTAFASGTFSATKAGATLTTDHLVYDLAGGDFDGNGLSDVVVSDTADRTMGFAAGATYVLPGGTLGTVSLPSAGHRFLGASDWDLAGHSVASGSDINGDGNEDLLIGATGAETEGAAYLVYGF